MPEQTTGGNGKYHFVLYIDSAKPKSVHAANRLDHICHSYLLKEAYTLEVVDLREEPLRFEEQRIIVAPTLDVVTPQFQKHRFVGDLSESEMFVMAVGMGMEAGQMGRQAVKMKQAAADMRGRIKWPGRLKSNGELE